MHHILSFLCIYTEQSRILSLLNFARFLYLSNDNVNLSTFPCYLLPKKTDFACNLLFKEFLYLYIAAGLQ